MSMDEFDQFDNNELSNELLERRRLRRAQLKKKRMIRQRIVIAAMVVIVMIIIALIARSCTAKNNERDKPPELSGETPVAPVTSSTTTATLAAVGDIMMYDDQLAAARKDDNTYDFTPAFRAVWAYTESADITVGNLELNFCGGPNYSGSTQSSTYFNAPESLASDLHKIGFDVLQTANTYSIVNGMDGLKSTINYLNKNGIEAVGTHLTDPAEAPDKGVVIRYSGPDNTGIKFAFIGFTKGLNGLALPNNSRYAVDLLYNDYTKAYEDIAVTAITERIEAAKAHDPDVIIAMVHWGSEFELDVSKTQREIRDLMFKNGVDVILGTHSHVVGPMETHEVKTVDGEQKTCFVAYSLGNFISGMDETDPNRPDTQKSVILNLEFMKDGATGETTISDIGYIPLYILDHKDDAVETRFEVLPIRSAISASTFEKYEDRMLEAINTLAANTASDYDSGT